MNEESIFAEAAEKPSATERRAYLERACRGDRDLRARIEQLLEAYDDPGSLLNEPAYAHTTDVLPRDRAADVRGVVEPSVENNPLTADGATKSIASGLHQPGDQIGPYKLLQKIGEGGFGVVYMAEQTEPVERRVALKIIKPGMDSGQVIARFEAERQALAMMDHPSIARVFDAGATGPASGCPGRPYFVMELVKGIPITAYCDEQHMTPKERLKLFVQVCHAVQHAHQKGIIHRDLKPSNVLVAEYDQQPVPKVIDFGIAKATSQKLTEKTMFTHFGQIMGTFEYMSPEQARLNQLDVDTRSDVYSLGVILYELLTGLTPFEPKRLRSAAFEEVLRIIREEDPPKPSTRISTSGDSAPTLSRNRRTTVQKLRQLVHGDLDWIVMKALEKDRGRRYETANAFADDLTRFLTDEPVRARPPSAVYRFRKFAKRNKAALAIAMTALVFIVGLGVAARVMAVQREELAAQRIASEAVRKLMAAPASSVLQRVSDVHELPLTREFLVEYASQDPEDANDRRQLHARIALSANDKSQLRNLLDSLLSKAAPEYVPVICAALRPYKDDLSAELWNVLQGNGAPAARFRAGLALADYAPDSTNWSDEDYRFLATHLLSERPEHQAIWRECLRGISDHCLTEWETLFLAGTSADTLLYSAYALLEYVQEDPQQMADLLSAAKPEQYRILFPAVDGSQDEALLSRLKEVAGRLPEEGYSTEYRIEYGRKRAGAGITLVRLGHYTEALATFDHTDDPESMTQFIHGCRERGVTADAILKCISALNESDRASKNLDRYALTLTLGAYELTEVPEAQRDGLVADLANRYRNDPSSAVHGATGWLLSQWGQGEIVHAVDLTPIAYTPDREWFTVAIQLPEPAGEKFFTFVVFPPGEYTIGSPPDELEVPGGENDELTAEALETRHRVEITRPFALLDRELTHAEVAAFKPEHVRLMGLFESRSPQDSGPGLMWYDSVRFCRWLTDQAGMVEDDQPYPAVASVAEEEYPRDLSPAARGALGAPPRNWPLRLDRSGFRLPTEAEWEVACRAGMRTRFGQGGDERLFNHYSWNGFNSIKDIHPPKGKMPNLRGLFDMHGNLFEWTHDWKKPYVDGVADYTGPESGDIRVLRGGCWGVGPHLSRAANRMATVPDLSFIFMGIRPALTLPSADGEVHQ